MIFNGLTSEEVTSVHHVYGILRKLGVVGRLMTITERHYITESGKPIRYNLKFVSYDETYKGIKSPEESLSDLIASSLTRLSNQRD